ncbi:universal stress protein [uncultured Methanobrevibacter sp.]|uniref:universal stress protein n=1 Tax=uncultured Methanobrevibacter sp. TaxID=253161 RepID=UPI002626C297|nr:universal stress protein [uncultured Methanobrevibacter sp.]
MYKKILLPTDGSGYSDEEVERATKLISDDGEIIILSVAGKLTSSAFQSRSNVRKINKGLLKEAQENVKYMKKLFDGEKLNIRTIVKPGFPAETIIKVAEDEEADLIIISSSGKSGLHRFILGSVTEEVLKNAEIDVLLVHNK